MRDDETKFEDYTSVHGYALEFAAIDAMERSGGKDEFFLGKAEGLCVAMAQLSGADLEWVRGHVCEQAF